MPLIADFDQLGVVRLLDVVGADALEHVAEQVELPVGVGGRRLRARAEQQRRGWVATQRQRRARRRAEKNEGSLAHHPRTFSPSPVRPPWAWIDGSPVLSELDIEHRLAASLSRRPAAICGRRFPSPQPVPRSARTGRDRRYPIHPSQQDMIPAAGIQDQELAVGAERSGVNHPAVGRRRHLGAGAGGDRKALFRRRRGRRARRIP